MPQADSHDHPHDPAEKDRWDSMMKESSTSGASTTKNPSYMKYDPKNFDVKYDPLDMNRATEFKILSCKRPHMRSFHFSWLSFFLAFVAWFAFAPLMPVIKKQIGLSKQDGWTVNIASVFSTVFMRFTIGPLCDEYGPRNLQSMMMMWGALMVLISAIVVNNTVSLGVMRFLIGIVGATFVPCQYWNTLLFTKEVAGSTQAMAGGWGNLGGGVTQVLMPLIYEGFLTVSDKTMAWRYTFLVPAIALSICGVTMYKLSDDSPMGNYSKLIKTGVMKKKTSTESAREGCTDWVTWLMFFQYGCCFGVELTVNNMMASYFFDRFDLTLVTAGAIASSFGLMNIFARALGGLFSDYLNKKIGFSGRLWAQMICLAIEGVFLVLFSRMNTVGSALPVLILFSVGVQMSEGSSFGIVPYIKPSATGTIAGVVGAGGNTGAVVWGLMFRFAPDGRPAQDTLMYIGFIVLIAAASCPLLFLETQPGMFGNPRYNAAGTKTAKLHLASDEQLKAEMDKRALTHHATDDELKAEISKRGIPHATTSELSGLA